MEREQLLLKVMRRTPRVVDLIVQNRDFELLDTIEEGKEITVHNHLTKHY